jgi:hypothetical protein
MTGPASATTTEPTALNPIRPLNLTETIESAVALVISNAPRIGAVLLLTNLPLLIWQALALFAPGRWIVPSRYRASFDAYALLELLSGLLSVKQLDAQLLVAYLVTLFCSLLQTATLTPLLAAWYRGRSLSINTALNNALARLPTLAFTYALPAGVILCAAWLYGRSVPATVLAGFILLVTLPQFVFLTHAVMLESRAPLAAWQRSVGIQSKRRWHVFGYWLMFEFVLLLLTSIPTFAVGLAAVNLPVGLRLTRITILAGNLTIMLMEPFRDAALTLLYFALLRSRRELP